MSEMNSPGRRWQGPKSDYPWEQQALDWIKGQLPDTEPYRAWQTFTFTTQHEKYAVTDEVLTAWTPPSPPRGRRRAS
jgi:hypothetical protein